MIAKMNDRNNNNIYKEIMIKIYQRVLADGDHSRRLPTLRTLAGEFGCTAPTVLRAVRELVNREILIRLPNGDYRTIPQCAPPNTRCLALVYGMGMQMLDSAFSADMKYNSIRYLMHLPERFDFSELRVSSCDDIENSIRSGIYSGVILCVPRESMLPSVTAACRDMGIPFGVFGGTSADDGDVSVFYDMEKNLLNLVEQLIQRKRRRILVLSLPLYRGNDTIREALEKVSGRFERAVFKAGSITELTDYIVQNVGGSGEDFDSVVYFINIYGTYRKIMEKAPDCLCVMSNFGVWQEKSFRGLMMNYDLESAGIRFGKAMAALLNKEIPENPSGSIPCPIQEIS